MARQHRLWREDVLMADLEAARARMLRDVDPDVVAESRRQRLAFVERIGTPRRCDTSPSEVHPWDGSCFYCGAINGQSCLAP